MRIAAGYENMAYADPIEDHTLRGLGSLLKLLPTLDVTARAKKAVMLWEALGDVEDRRSTGTFSGSYRWYYYRGRHSRTFDAAFVRQLKATAWVPDANGDLQCPEFVVFDSLSWKPNPFLFSKIRFKSPIIEVLAREAGIEPGVLDLLKKRGVTSVADLHRLLGIKEQPETPDLSAPGDVDDALKKLLGDVPAPTPPVPDPAGAEPSGSGSGRGGSGRGTGAGAGSGSGKDAGERAEGAATGSAKRTPGGAGGRPFISYIAAQPDEEDRDPDGLDQPARMALEALAINIILAREPQWQRTPTHNPGYDLFEPGEDAMPARWCEVKAMTGGLQDRPVGLSHTQFKCAQKQGAAYWLYVVEHAGDEGARVIRIQDPAGKARTFTFDRGWLDVAEVDGAAEVDAEQED
jgi:hypothetical protein